MKVKCCNKMRDGNFCGECGRRLIRHREQKLLNRITELETGIFNYVEAYHKKMAGSTIQYSIEWLERLIDPDNIGYGRISQQEH